MLGMRWGGLAAGCVVLGKRVSPEWDAAVSE